MDIDNGMIYVTVKASGGANDGFSFPGMGAVQNADPNQPFGGVVYAYGPHSLNVWKPHQHHGFLVYVNPNLGGGMKSQSSNDGSMVVRLWEPYTGTCPINSTSQPVTDKGNLTTPALVHKDGCVYKSVVYQQGQRWNDGCNYLCMCLDASQRQYNCVERCPRFNNIPAHQCFFSDPCCRIPECTNTTPFFGRTTEKTKGMISDPGTGTVSGTSSTGTRIFGQAPDGTSSIGTGIVGQSPDGTGTTGTGIVDQAPDGTGTTGTGIVDQAPDGTGTTGSGIVDQAPDGTGSTGIQIVGQGSSGTGSTGTEIVGQTPDGMSSIGAGIVGQRSSGKSGTGTVKTDTAISGKGHVTTVIGIAIGACLLAACGITTGCVLCKKKKIEVENPVTRNRESSLS